MKYVQISTHADGWGKTILFEKHRELESQGVESYVFWARGDHEQNEYMQKIASLPESVLDLVETKIDGKIGFHSTRQTAKLLKRLDEINPDVVHLHVLIGYYLNVEMLFSWLKQSKCQVVWTLHDCWAFTGHCIHFTEVGCTQWMTCCGSKVQCPQTDAYPKTYNKKSVKWNYEKKRELFTSLPSERMSLIVPSNWLASLVEKSFLAKYPIKVCHNTVDKTVFKKLPCGDQGADGEKCPVVLGVSTAWSTKKGLDDFLRLACDLEGKATVRLVGLTERQRKKIGRMKLSNLDLRLKTDSIDELVQHYNEASVFFNPTKEDNYPTVNLEAEACGTSVVTYDVGGCRETIKLPGSICVKGYDEALASISSRLI